MERDQSTKHISYTDRGRHGPKQEGGRSFHSKTKELGKNAKRRRGWSTYASALSTKPSWARPLHVCSYSSGVLLSRVLAAAWRSHTKEAVHFETLLCCSIKHKRPPNSLYNFRSFCCKGSEESSKQVVWLCRLRARAQRRG